MFAKLLGICLLLATVAVIAARQSAGAGPEEIYIVKRADTLWSIAARHYSGDVREGVWKLQHRNHLAGATIRPGQRLVVPR
jgi:nucleoid-associated protein YgaU